MLDLLNNQVFKEWLIYQVQLWQELLSTAESDSPSGVRLKAMDKKQVLQQLFEKLIELTEEKDD